MMRNIYQNSSRQYPVASQAVMNSAISGIGRYTAAQMSSMAAVAAGNSYMSGQFPVMQNHIGNNNFQDHMLHYQAY